MKIWWHTLFFLFIFCDWVLLSILNFLLAFLWHATKVISKSLVYDSWLQMTFVAFMTSKTSYWDSLLTGYLHFRKRVYLYYTALWSLLFPSIVKLQKSSFCQVNTEEASHKHSAPPVCFSGWKIPSKAEKAIWQFWQHKAPLTACLTDFFSRSVIVFPESLFP